MLHAVLRVVLYIHELSDQSHHAWEFTLAVEDLIDKQLFIALFLIIFFLRFQIIRIGQITLVEILKITDTTCVEPEFLVKKCISVVSSLHVGICFSNWDNEINIKMVNDVDNQTKHNDETSVFKVSKLDIHCSKFNSPSDFGIVRRWRLEPKRIPVCRLNVLEVRHNVVVINLFFDELSLVRRHRVPHE